MPSLGAWTGAPGFYEAPDIVTPSRFTLNKNLSLSDPMFRFGEKKKNIKNGGSARAFVSAPQRT